MRVIIHAGPQKTGTTYLQTALTALADRLAADGIRYLRTAGGGTLRNTYRTPIAESLARRPLPDIAKEFVEARAAGVQTLLISSEKLAGLDARILAPLRDATRLDAVEVVFYSRRWSDRLPAQWSQFVIGGVAKTLPDWLDGELSRGLQSPYLNNARLWQRWADLFGRSAIRLVAYDVLAATRTPLLEHFLRDVVGWSGDTSLGDARLRSRPRFSMIETELLRAINTHAQALGKRHHHSARMAPIRKLRRADGEPFASLIGKRTLPIDDGGPVLAPYAATIEPWRDRLVTSGLDGRPVIPQRLEVAIADPAWLANPAAAEAIAAAYARVLRYESRHAPDLDPDDD